MSSTAPPTIVEICRYPVKGLSAEPLERVDLTPGEGLPEDRRFAIAHGSTRFDPAAPEWLPKTSFLMLMRNERLAKLRTHYDAATGTLAIERDGKPVAKADISTPSGRMVIEGFFAAFMGAECRGAPKLVEAPCHMFSDTRPKVVSLISRASLRDLERVVRAPVDRLRFRGNVYFDGAAPWAEMQWPGRQLRIGGALLRVTKTIDRCAATNVNPATAERDLNIPLALREGYRHVDCGVYAEVLAGGPIAVGDTITVED